MNFRSVVHCLGWSLAAFSVTMCLPMFLAILNGDLPHAWYFGACAIFTAFVGASALLVTQGSLQLFAKRECYLFLVMLWPALGLFGATPFLLAYGELPFSLLWFESVSGITTTGATVLPALDEAAPAITLWRGLLQWSGGFVTLVTMFVLMSFLGTGGLSVFQSVMPTGESNNIAERAGQTAISLLPVYVMLTAICAAALWAAGIPAFDAVCLAFSTISTGGFMPWENGLAVYDANIAPFVLVLFMFAGMVNFSLHWSLMQGRPQPYMRNRELRYLIYILLAFVCLFIIWLFASEDLDPGENILPGLFAILSLLSTTGFDIAPEGFWQTFPPVFVIALVLLGGTTGSTAGGIKLMRFSVLAKQAQRELARLSHPHAVVALKFGRRRIDDAMIGSVWSFFFAFVLAIAVFTIILSFHELDSMTALAAAISSLCNVGPALLMIEPNAVAYPDLPSAAHIWLTLAMILGRLELLIFLAILMPAYWRG